MVKSKVFVLMIFVVVLVNAQDQTGFISIDCGLPDNSSYTDGSTGLHYVSDAQYLNTENGVSKTISPLYQTVGLDQQFNTVRSFPTGNKNCYTLNPPLVQGRARFFVRARFYYGNYDNKNQIPVFDLYLGTDYWVTIQFNDAASPRTVEILYVPSKSTDSTLVCLVNTGNGASFISALEVRLVNDDIYQAGTDSLQLYSRHDVRAYQNLKVIRYADDVYDRVWRPSFTRNESVEIKAPINITEDHQNIYLIPSLVMQTAVTRLNASAPIRFYWAPKDPAVEYYVYMHFADFQSNSIREFNITINEMALASNFRPRYLNTTTVHNILPQTAAVRVNFTLIKTARSALPPILNALELYIVRRFTYQLTDQQDLSAIEKIKAAYGLKKDWQGDPCLPANYPWEGLSCYNMTSNNDPRIVSLNLSSSGLSGKITPYISNLAVLRSLDLSNNSLTGAVPDFFTQMEDLNVLILSGNNLSGAIPTILFKKWKSGSLKLSVDGNPNLCASDTCETKKENNSTAPPTPVTVTKEKNKLLVPLIAVVASAIVLLILLGFSLIVIFILKKSSSRH